MTAAEHQRATSTMSIWSDLESVARRTGGAIFLTILALATIFSIALLDLRSDKILALPSHHTEASKEDIVAFQRAGALAIEGRASEIYDAAVFRETLAPQHQGLRFINPPHFLFVAAPMAATSYPLLKFSWLSLSIVCMLMCVGIARAHPVFLVLALASPATFASLLVMQSGPMVAVCLAGALVLSERRPLAAGLLLAILTMKPQYGLFALYSLQRSEDGAPLAGPRPCRSACGPSPRSSSASTRGGRS